MERRNYAIPSDFLDRIRARMGTEAAALEAALEGDPVTAGRLHPWKGRREDFSPEARPVPWVPTEGLYLPERPPFVFDPLWHAGAYYVQEPSSMFIPYLIEWKDRMRILDLSAAPGGKSTHLLAHLDRCEGLLVSNEPEGKRWPALVENLHRWGIGRQLITRAWPKQWEAAGEAFDVVLVDAPCSGEGMFRKLPAARAEWSLRRIQACSRTQQDILRSAARLVRPGGLLIYSTCTFAPEENEAQIKHLYAQYGTTFEPYFKEVPPEWGIVTDAVDTPAGPQMLYRFYPHRLTGEGLTVTVFRKQSALGTSPVARKKTPSPAFRPTACPAEWPLSDGWQCIEWEEDVRAFPAAHLDFIHRLPRFRKMRPGVGLARRRRKGHLPHPEWPLSQFGYGRHIYPSVSLSDTEALQYLKGAPLYLAAPHKGWLLLTFRKRILGWGKALPDGRINNYYPPAWRIRKEVESKKA